MTRHLTRLLSAIVLAGIPHAQSQAADDAPFWPQFHGPRRDNLATETGLMKRWPEAGPRHVWTARGIGHGFSSISIADGLIYTAGNVGPNTVITALATDGKIRYQVPNGKAWTDPVPGSRSTPTIDGDRLYHQSPHGNVVCLEAKTGKKLWALNVLEEFHAGNITWAVSASLLIDGDHVICCPGGMETAVVALDKHTGRTVWKSAGAGDKAGYSSPALGEHGRLRMIFVLTSGALIGVNADGGDLLFRFPHNTPFDENILMPIFHQGHVFITTRTTGAVKLKVNVDGDKASVQPVWRTRNLDNQHGGVILSGGHLYGSCFQSNNGRWACLDWETGRMTCAQEGVGRGSLTYAHGMLYTLSERSQVGLVKADPAGHQVISRFELPPGGKGRSWAHPVVCGGRLYIRHSDFLYAYDVRARE